MSKDFQGQIDVLAELIREFKLTEVSLESEHLKVVLKKSAAPAAIPTMVQAGAVSEIPSADGVDAEDDLHEETSQTPATLPGIPITSPMTGIFYTASGPSAPPFVKEGDSITAGQVIGLIEAMKVYSEIHATTSGIVKKIVAQNGEVLNPGDVIMTIG